MDDHRQISFDPATSLESAENMEYRDRLDIAAEQMDRLVKSDLLNKLREANEATVRLLIIDEVLIPVCVQKGNSYP